jgi:FkbM family methyltransferase
VVRNSCLPLYNVSVKCNSSFFLGVGSESSIGKSDVFHFFPDAPAESSRYPLERQQQREKTHSHCAGVIEEEEDPIPVICEMNSISSIISTLQLSDISLVKIDVEGDEINVINDL